MDKKALEENMVNLDSKNQQLIIRLKKIIDEKESGFEEIRKIIESIEKKKNFNEYKLQIIDILDEFSKVKTEEIIKNLGISEKHLKTMLNSMYVQKSIITYINIMDLINSLNLELKFVN